MVQLGRGRVWSTKPSKARRAPQRQKNDSERSLQTRHKRKFREEAYVEFASKKLSRPS